LRNASAPDCCYNKHCPTYDYPVIPSAIADEVNAVAKLEHYYGKEYHRLHRPSVAARDDVCTRNVHRVLSTTHSPQPATATSACRHD
jgi:hypothetical protein